MWCNNLMRLRPVRFRSTTAAVLLASAAAYVLYLSIYVGNGWICFGLGLQDEIGN